MTNKKANNTSSKDEDNGKQVPVSPKVVNESLHRNDRNNDGVRHVLNLKFCTIDKLTKETDYPLWKDKLIGEIKAKECGFTIYNDVAKPVIYKMIDDEKIKTLVRNFIISALDDYHHRMIRDVNNLREMIASLYQLKEPSGRTTLYSLSTEFATMRYKTASEPVTDFVNQYQRVVERLRACGGTVTPAQELMNLVLATREAFPEVYSADVQQKDPMTVSKIRQLLIEEEASRGEIKQRETAKENAMIMKPGNWKELNQTAKMFEAKKAALTCYKCGMKGHMQDDCTKNRWKCYNCDEFTDDHISATCQLPKANTSTRGTGTNLQGSGSRPATNFNHLNKKPTTTSKGKFGQRMKQIPLPTAQQIARLRKQAGKAMLTYEDDPDTKLLPKREQYVYMEEDTDDNDNEYNEVASYAKDKTDHKIKQITATTMVTIKARKFPNIDGPEQ